MERPVIEACRELVRRVGRAYYDAKYVIILDILSRNNIVKDEDLAKGLKMSTVDVRKLCAKLRADGLIKIHSRTEEIKEFRNTKKITKANYYLDYRSFVNVVKYKMYKIQEVIKKEVEKYNNNLEYTCLVCNTDYDALSSLALSRNEEEMFLCEICSTPLEQKQAADLENDLSKKFNTARKPILDLLQETDAHEIPEFDLGSIATAGGAKELSFSTETGAKASRIMVELEGFAEEDEQFAKEEPDEFGDLDFKEYYANLARTAGDQSNDASTSEPDRKRIRLEELADDDDDDDEEFVEA
ncbi:hypothetical protein HDU97_010170 [Phlyctochytrium planicorne]|nr:hypothetical protein HDU97_010170 [Phlyctochytrium planicorne]